jgi:hypothetical protein
MSELNYFIVTVAGKTALVESADTTAQVWREVARKSVTVEKASAADVANFFRANEGAKVLKVEDIGAAANDEEEAQPQSFGGTAG